MEAIKLPVCMVYGKNDPWITPIFAQQIKIVKPDAEYYEISPSGTVIFLCVPVYVYVCYVCVCVCACV